MFVIIIHVEEVVKGRKLFEFNIKDWKKRHKNLLYGSADVFNETRFLKEYLKF